MNANQFSSYSLNHTKSSFVFVVDLPFTISHGIVLKVSRLLYLVYNDSRGEPQRRNSGGLSQETTQHQTGDAQASPELYENGNKLSAQAAMRPFAHANAQPPAVPQDRHHSPCRSPTAAITAVLILARLACWALVGLVLRAHAQLIGTAAIARPRERRHALDAGHVSCDIVGLLYSPSSRPCEPMP